MALQATDAQSFGGCDVTRAICVGLTSYPPNDQGRYFLALDYVQAVHRAGAIPILFPPIGDHAQAWLDRVDALVMPGGGDVDPLLYGAEPHPLSMGVNPARDVVELALLRAAWQRRMPMLLICRGMQLLNVALGGTLHQHVPDRYGDRVAHRDPERKPVPHSVRVEPGTRLHRIVGTAETRVASLHHQAVDVLAPGLRPAAYAADGLLEACEAVDRWAVAVQWHPEATAEHDADQRSLFDALVAEAAGRGLRAAAE